MGAFADYLASEQAAPAIQPAAVDQPSQFGLGLRAGLGQLEAGLNNFAGGAAEAMGADQFARERYAAAQQPVAEGPRVGSFQDVHSLRDAGDYLAGLAGGMVPSAALAVGGGLLGRTPVGRALGGAAALLPGEAGDVIGRQQQAPGGPQGSAQDRFGQALAGGGASALANAVPGAGLAGKVAAPLEREAASAVLSRGLRGMPGHIALNAGLGAGSEAVKQAAAGQPTDPNAIEEAAVGGGVLGGAMHGLGTAVEAGRAGVGNAAASVSPTNILAGVKERAGSLVDSAQGAAADLAAKVPSVPSAPSFNPLESLREVYDQGKQASQDFIDRVASGDDIANMQAVAGKSAEQIKAMLPELDAQRVQQAKQWASEMLDKAGLDEGRRQQLMAAAQDLTDRGNQAIVAGMKKGMDATSDFAARAKALYDSFRNPGQDAAPAAGDTKKSEDFSGIRQAIAEELVPALKKVNPDVFDDPKALGEAADGVRMAIDHFREGTQLSSDQIHSLIDAFGSETVNVLDAVHRTMGKVSPAENERFYTALSDVNTQQMTDGKTVGLMRSALLPELKDSVSDAQLRQELRALQQWATSAIDRNSAEGRLRAEQVKTELDSRYGGKSGKILDAVEKTAPKESSQLERVRAKIDEDGNRVLPPDGPDTLTEHEASALRGQMIEHAPKSGDLYLEPSHERKVNAKAGRPAEHDATAQALTKAMTENPDKSVSFVSAKELGADHPLVANAIKRKMADFINDGMEAAQAHREAQREIMSGRHGIVAAEGEDLPGSINRKNIRRVMVASTEGEKAKTSHREQDSVFKVGNVNYDAVALTKLMKEQFKGEHHAEDEKGAQHRTGRMFMAGVAALQDHLGKSFELPDKLRIDQDGTTVGDVKKLGFMPLDARAERLNAKLEELRKKYKATDVPREREQIKKLAEDLIDHAKADDPRMEFERRGGDDLEGEPDPFGNIHAAVKGLGEEGAAIHAGLDGQTTKKSNKPNNERLKPEELKALTDKFEALRDKAPSAGAKAVAQRGLELLANEGVLNKSAHRTLFGMLSKGTKVSDVASQVNALHEKYKNQFVTKPEVTKPEFNVDHIVTHDDFDQLKTPAQTDKFLVEAAKRYAELRAEDKRLMNADDDAAHEAWWKKNRDAYGRLGDMFESDSHADLSSFYPDFGMDGERSDASVRAMIAKAVPEVAARSPKGSLVGATRAARWTGSEKEIADVRAYVDKVLGPSVKTVLASIPHAGEYVNDTIRISVHALDPASVGYHEALHGFMDKLIAQGNAKVGAVLEKAAMAAPVQNQLRALLASERGALAQLAHPEEAAAYMYQFWAAGKLKVGDQTGNLFQRIKAAIAKAFGVWTNDRRAEEILNYFHSGEFAKNGMGQPSDVARALLQTGRNEVLERAKGITKPLANLADALTTAGGQRLRDTGVPALRELADLMKVTGREGKESNGFIPASRLERTRVMNQFAQSLRGYTEAHIDDALKALQSGAQASSAEGRLVQREVRKLLDDQLAYMKKAGVDVAKIQPRPDYFPRLYDAHYISRHQADFAAVLEKHGIPTKEAQRITTNLMATDGAEFTVETDRPGMQNLKRRELAMIPDSELAPFMRKNLFEVMNSYVTQATRRAEWARRFGDDGLGIARLLTRAKAEGAEAGQVEAARKYVRAIDGTLGDSISPMARRFMGNMIVYQNMRLLPLAIFSSVVDPLGVMVRGGTIRDAFSTFKRGIKEIPANFKKDFKYDADTELAATLGVIDDAMLAHTTSQLYTQGMVGDGVKKINDAFFRFNLMEGFNRSMRVGATQAAIRFLARHNDGTASPHSVRWLAELGLKPGEFDASLKDPKTVAAINQWVDGAVLRPDAADKPIWMSDPHWALVSHLKQFVFSFQETILKRVAHEAAQGNYAPAMALTSYVPVMIASDLIKGLIQGGGTLPSWKQDWGPEDYIGSGIERAGLLGKLQFPVDGVGMMMGPTAQQALGLAEALDGKGGVSRAALKALPASTLYAGWVDSGSNSRVENSMSVD